MVNCPALLVVAPAPSFPRSLAGTTIAVARDAAFCFLYPANLECLEQLGARLVYFSPLTDAALPACDAVWLPGGYTELHGPTLAPIAQASKLAGKGGEAIYRDGRLTASYMHFYFPSNPATAAQLFLP